MKKRIAVTMVLGTLVLTLGFGIATCRFIKGDPPFGLTILK